VKEEKGETINFVPVEVMKGKGSLCGRFVVFRLFSQEL